MLLSASSGTSWSAASGGSTSVDPAASSTAAATRGGSRTSVRSTNATPSGKRGAAIAATAIASRVLPTPGGPVSVRSRVSGSVRSRSSAATSSFRPTSVSGGAGSERRCPRASGPPGPRPSRRHVPYALGCRRRTPLFVGNSSPPSTNSCHPANVVRATGPSLVENLPKRVRVDRDLCPRSTGRARICARRDGHVPPETVRDQRILPPVNHAGTPPDGLLGPRGKKYLRSTSAIVSGRRTPTR